MNPPQVYMCSPSWTPTPPPPSPYHPSGSSQCTSPEHPVSCIEPGLAIHFTYDNIHVSMITLYARQQKRHRCIEQSFGLYGRGRGWDDLGEWHWHRCNIIYESNRQSRFDAWYRMLGAGALGWPRGMVQVYMCSPSWTLLPPPSPFHPSGSSQCTSPKHPVSCIEPGLATCFIYDIIHVSMPFSHSVFSPCL